MRWTGPDLPQGRNVAACTIPESKIYRKYKYIFMFLKMNSAWRELIPFLLTVERCNEPPFLENTEFIDGVDASNGSSVTYTCQLGYMFPDQSHTRNVTCLPVPPMSDPGVWEFLGVARNPLQWQPMIQEGCIRQYQALLSLSHLSTKYSQKTTRSSAVRTSYGVSFVSSETNVSPRLSPCQYHIAIFTLKVYCNVRIIYLLNSSI